MTSAGSVLSETREQFFERRDAQLVARAAAEESLVRANSDLFVLLDVLVAGPPTSRVMVAQLRDIKSRRDEALAVLRVYPRRLRRSRAVAVAQCQQPGSPVGVHAVDDQLVDQVGNDLHRAGRDIAEEEEVVGSSAPGVHCVVVVVDEDAAPVRTKARQLLKPLGLRVVVLVDPVVRHLVKRPMRALTLVAPHPPDGTGP